MPDKWLICKLDGENTEYRVLGSWSGGYLNGDSWRLNSGITSVVETGDYLEFAGTSGSVYRCHKDMYGAHALGHKVLQRVVKTSENEVNVMPEDTDWLAVEWS